jgi:hypothetical protein
MQKHYIQRKYLTPVAKILKHNLCPKGRKHIARGVAPCYILTAFQA